MNQVLRNIAVVGQQLFGVFGQAVTAVAEAGIVVMRADTWIEANTVDDLLSIEAMGGGVGIKLVKVRDAHGQVSVGKELDSFGFRSISKKDGDVLLDGAFFEQTSEDLGALGAFTHDDARRVQVVIEGPAFTQELGREDKILRTHGFASFDGITHGDGRLDDHGGIRINRHNVTYHRLNGFGIEVVGFRVIVGRGSDNDVVRPFVSVLLIERGPEVQWLVLEVVLKFFVINRGLIAIEHRDFLRDDVEGYDFMVLRQQHTV